MLIAAEVGLSEQETKVRTVRGLVGGRALY